METVNALKIRQSLGSVLAKLKKTGTPIYVERNRDRVAVLISIEDFKKRFVDKDADEARELLVNKILGANLKTPNNVNTLDLINSNRR